MPKFPVSQSRPNMQEALYVQCDKVKKVVAACRSVSLGFSTTARTRHLFLMVLLIDGGLQIRARRAECAIRSAAMR